MKKIIIIIILITNFTFSQNKITNKSNIFYYGVTFSDANLYNREFELSVAVRIENYLPNSKLDIGLIEKDENSKFLNFTSLYYENIRNKEWKIYKIKGTIQPNSTKFEICAICRNKGDFYFDDVNLKTMNHDGKWENYNIKNSGFENEINMNEWNTTVSDGSIIEPINFTFLHTNYKPYKGKSCLFIKGNDILGSSLIGKYVDVNGVSLYYETYGEGEPLLLLHGNGGSISAFMNQVDEFSKLYKVIIVDCRGRGNSTYQKDVELNFDIQIEDLNQFLDKINIPKTHIVGWSDGGILGLLMAIQHPEKVNKLVSMAGNIFPEGCVDLEGMIKTRDELVADNKDHKNDLYIDLYNLDIKYPNLKYEDLSVIKSKTLIMAGDHDEIKNEHTIKMFEAIPGAQLAILPNSTHYLPEQNPKLFNQIVLDFLK